MKHYYVAGSLCLLAVCLTVQGGATVKKEDVPKYLKQLQSSQSGQERAFAADMLGKRGAINLNDVKDAIGPLKTSVQKDVDANVRKAAATALAAIGAEPSETIPLLTDVLKKDKSVDVKLGVVRALAAFGPEAKSALPAINALAAELKDDKKAQAIIKDARKSIAVKKKA